MTAELFTHLYYMRLRPMLGDKLLVCLLCNFCIFGNCSLSFKIIYTIYVVVYYDVINKQPRFNFSDEIIQ